jgi:hypothetical protein
MPPNFPVLDAILVTCGKVIGIQIKPDLGMDKLMQKIITSRSSLKQFKDDGCDLLGPEGLVVYRIGSDVAPTVQQVQPSANERLVTAGQLRELFVYVFFRLGADSCGGRLSLRQAVAGGMGDDVGRQDRRGADDVDQPVVAGS